MTTQQDGTLPNQTQWTSTQRVATTLSALLAAVSIPFALLGDGWQFGLLFSIPLSLIAGYYVAPRPYRTQWQSLLIDHVVIIMTLVALIAIEAALIPWLVVNFWWLPAYEQEQQQPLSAEASPVQIVATLPGGVFADGEPHPITLHFSNITAVTQTVTTTVQLQPASALVAIAGPQQTAVVGPRQEMTASLSLANTNPPPGDWAVENVMIMGAATNDKPVSQTAAVRVEGVFGARLRRFVTTTVDNASPLIILVAFLVPALGTLAQQYIDRYRKDKEQAEAQAKAEEKEKAAKAAKLRQQQQAALRQQQQDKASQLCENIRNHLRAREIDRAKTAYAQWDNDPNLTNYLSEEKTIARHLLELATLSSEGEIASQIQKGRAWPNASVAAFVSSWRRCREKRKREKSDNDNCMGQLAGARYLLPKVTQIDPDLQNELARIAVEIVAREKRSGDFSPIKDWPRPSRQPTGIKTSHAWIDAAIPNGKDPFAHEKAEADCYNLFHTDGPNQDMAFWGGHPLFNPLFSIDRPVLIFGSPGSGRTTLAQALHYYAPRREVFALHLTGTPSTTATRRRFAAHLLNFVLSYPSYLRLLTGAERRLLAQLLAQSLGQTAVSAQVEAKQAHLLGTPPVVETEENTHEKLNSSEQLQLLNQAIMEASLKSRLQAWPGEVGAAVRALKFKQALLVLEVDETEAAAAWLQETILPELSDWHAAGLTAVIFLPGTIADHVSVTASAFYLRRLAWQRNDFYKMLDWRYKAIAGSYQALEQHFDYAGERNALQALIDACQLDDGSYNPKQFVQLWQKIVSTLPADQDLITQAKVAAAALATPMDDIIMRDISPPTNKEKSAQEPVSRLITTLDPAPSETVRRKYADRRLLRKVLENAFNLSELRTLCFDFGIDYEYFSKTKSDMVREMIDHFDRRNLLGDLWSEVCRQRPHACPDGV